MSYGPYGHMRSFLAPQYRWPCPVFDDGIDHWILGVMIQAFEHVVVLSMMSS